MAIQLKISQHKDTNKNIDGKWFAKTICTDVVDINELAERISENTTFKQSDVIGVVCAVVEEMKHQMEDGKTVALGDLGRFKYSIQSDLVDSPNVFNPNKHIKKVVCKFTPKGVRDQLTKKMIYPMLENLKFHVMK